MARQIPEAPKQPISKAQSQLSWARGELLGPVYSLQDENTNEVLFCFQTTHAFLDTLLFVLFENPRTRNRNKSQTLLSRSRHRIHSLIVHSLVCFGVLEECFVLLESGDCSVTEVL